MLLQTNKDLTGGQSLSSAERTSLIFKIITRQEFVQLLLKKETTKGIFAGKDDKLNDNVVIKKLVEKLKGVGISTFKQFEESVVTNRQQLELVRLLTRIFPENDGPHSPQSKTIWDLIDLAEQQGEFEGNDDFVSVFNLIKELFNLGTSKDYINELFALGALQASAKISFDEYQKGTRYDIDEIMEF